MFWLCSLAIVFASASTSLSQTVEPERNVRNGPDRLPWLCSKSSPKKTVASYPVYSSCQTVLRHELVETEIRECGLRNHVYSTQDFRIRGNISQQETEPQQLTQHLHEPVVERNHELKMLLFLHQHYCFLRRQVRMLRDLGEIGSTDHHLNTKVIEDSGSSSAPRCDPPIPLPEARHGHIPQH